MLDFLLSKTLPRRAATVTASISILSLALLFCSSSFARDSQSLKLQQVKAAFVLNISKFITWPEENYQRNPNELALCYYQHDILDAGFDSIHGKTVNGRRLTKATVIEHLVDSTECNILLLSSDTLTTFTMQSHGHLNPSVLTVLDATDQSVEGLAYSGVHIRLVRQNTHIKLEVNLAETRRSGLNVSSELLKLARITGREH